MVAIIPTQPPIAVKAALAALPKAVTANPAAANLACAALAAVPKALVW